MAPPWWLVKIEDEAEYTRQFKEQLLQLDPAKVMKDLGPDAILLCWEAPGKFCHRRIVADWLARRLGIEVPEYEPGTPPPAQPELKLDLF